MQHLQTGEGGNNVGSEQTSSSDDGQFVDSVVALRRMMEKEIEVMVIRTVQQVIGPTVEDLIRKVVKEEIQSARENFLASGNQTYTNDAAVPMERQLCLKFLDEVSAHVLTGEEIKGKGGTPMRVALVDMTTEKVVESGPESSAKVEILVLEASDDDERNWRVQDFNTRIIKEGDKKKPHFPKSNYLYLKEGSGTLCNAKLAHDSSWMKNCRCRLGARIVENLSGSKVQEAWTESFTVSDSRGMLYKKHYPPSLSDPVWRLENIGKKGAPCQRLNENNVFTVKDFLFLCSINPQRLQQIVGVGACKAMDHAQTCKIDDERICMYNPSSEFNMGVVFDVVGRLKGVIRDSHYVPNNYLPEAEKGCAHNLLLSAFENKKDITFFDDETALLRQLPNRASNAITNSIIQEGPHDFDLAICESINRCDPTEPGTSSRSICPSIRPSGNSNNICDFGSLGWTSMGHPHDLYFGVPNLSPSCQFSDFDPSYFDDLMLPVYPGSNNHSETLWDGSHSHEKGNADIIHVVRTGAVMRWMFRAKKRVMASGGMHVSKKQRI